MVAAVAAEDSAVPPTEMIMPFRRPSRSTSGPTQITTTKVPMLTSVETSSASLVLQPKSAAISGSSVPNRMKS